MNNNFVTNNQLEQHAHNLLEQRGVKLEDIAFIVYELQKEYVDDLTIDQCLELSLIHI